MEVVAVGFNTVVKMWYGGKNKIKELDVSGWSRSLDTDNKKEGERVLYMGSIVGWVEGKESEILRKSQRLLEVRIVLIRI